MRDSRVSPADPGRHLRIVSDTDERVLEAFADSRAACEAHLVELIEWPERARLVARAQERLRALGYEVEEERPEPPPRPSYRRKRVRYLNELNREHVAAATARQLERAMLDPMTGEPRAIVDLSPEEAAELVCRLRSIAYSIGLEKGQGGRR